MKWADNFFNIMSDENIIISSQKRINGWIESVKLNNKIYFVKSCTYDINKRQYFQGVDPKKLNEIGDQVLICGGLNNRLKDIFIIPWNIFFNSLMLGTPINTYKLPKEYFQYKLYIRDRNDKWLLYVQPIKKTEIIDITKYRFNVAESIEIIKTV